MGVTPKLGWFERSIFVLISSFFAFLASIFRNKAKRFCKLSLKNQRSSVYSKCSTTFLSYGKYRLATCTHFLFVLTHADYPSAITSQQSAQVASPHSQAVLKTV